MKFIKTRDNVISPERAHENDSWIDFFLPEEIIIMPWDNVKIPLGIKVKLPEGFDLTFVNKSWIASSTWVIVWACLVDNWYRGELILNLINTSKYQANFVAGQKIAQGVIRKVSLFAPDELSELEWETEMAKEDKGRGLGGFGSTGLAPNKEENEDS